MQNLFVTPPSPLLTRKPFPTNPKDLAELSEKMGQVANEYLLAPKQLTAVRSLPRCENCLSNLPTAAQLVSELIEASSAVFSAATRQTSASARFATYSADLSGLHGLMNGGLLTGGASVDWYPARVGGHQLCLCSGKLLLAARPALEAANQLFSDRFMQGALEHYTAGLLWTPREPVLPADAPPEALMNKSALAYGNRSVVYHRLRQWEATMAEVDRAIALGHGPLKKRSLLVKRKIECLLNLNRIAEAEALFREHEREQETYEAAQRAKAAEANGGGEQPPVATAVTLLQQFQWQRLKAATEHGKSSTYPTEATVDGGQLATVAGAIAVLQAKGLFEGGKSEAPSRGLPRWLSRKLQFKKEEEGEEGGKAQSKYLIALEPITAGEVLAVVKPLALVPLQAAHFGGTDAFGSLGARRCDHCQSACFLSPVSVETLRGRGKKDQSNGKRPLLTSTTKPPLLVRMPTPVPCTACSQALYCGERCRDEAWAAYHRWECRLHSGQLAEKLAEPEVRLALRLLLAAGDVQALKEIATLNEADEEEGETEEEDFNYRLEYEKLVTSSGGSFNGPPGPARGTLTEEWAKMFTASLLVQLLKACNFYEVGSSLSYL